jgi:predicted nucleotidyltransferase
MEPGEIIERVWAEFRAHYPGPDQKLFLFGSRAKGTHRPTSDFDFLIVDPKRETEAFEKFRARVAQIPTLYSIDLTLEHSASESFKRVLNSEPRKEILDGKVTS